jgi:hypothetical protein
MQIDRDALTTKLRKNKDTDFEYQKRRHEQWKENYELYRDTVITNRLTNRQTVNIPLMKATIKTIQSGINQPMDLVFDELGNDKQKEIFKNEYWKWNYDTNKLVLKTVVDKKQVLLYGRSWWKLNIRNGRPYQEVLDPQDVLIDRHVDPTDSDTADHIIHIHIFRDLDELTSNEDYDKEVISQLKLQYMDGDGLKLSKDNFEAWMAKNQRMREMGLQDVDDPQPGATIVEINEHYVKLWDEDKKKKRIFLVTTADGEILLSKPLEEVLGKTEDHYWDDHFPLVTWADDVERLDFYSDGWADVARQPNKVINAWISQLVENRTLRNFGMNFYDATMENFVPQSWDAQPWGWYGIPVPEGKGLKDVFTKVEIPDLSDSLDEMDFVIKMVEAATAATAANKGVSEDRQVTLGEVKMLFAQANERVSDIKIFFTEAYRQLGEKWAKICEAASDSLEAVKLFKKSYKGNYFSAEVAPADWKSKVGYRCRVLNKKEQQEETLESIQKFNAVRQFFPGNAPFNRIMQKRLLDIVDVTPEESKEVMDFEEQAISMIPPGGMAMPTANPSLTPMPNAIPTPQAA